MPLFDIPWLSESIKKRALRYLLQRYLGNFLLEKLTLDQLSVDLYNGKGAIRDLILDVDGLNDELKFLPFKFLDGSIVDLNVSVPWATLLTDACTVQLNGASFVCQMVTPIKGDIDSTIISKSLMTSSMQIAEEIVNEEEDKFDGLEMFAQLIDSVLRRVKLFAENTSLMIVAPKKCGDGDQLEVRIKHLQCEEEEQIGDSANDAVNLSQELLTKIITLEGVEFLINDVLVCKLSGKHSFRIKIEENKSDIQIYIGSYVLALLTSKQLEKLLDFFNPRDQSNSQPTAGEKLMSSTDYARIEQQLQMDAGFPNANPAPPNSSMTVGPNKWSACPLESSEPNFLPMNKLLGDGTMKKIKATKPSIYSCHVKLPGLIVCLLSDEEDTSSLQYHGAPLNDIFNSFQGVSDYLDEILEDFCHLRFIAFRLFFDINSKTFSMSCGDVMVQEKTKSRLTQVLWSENQSQVLDSPKFRLKVDDNKININFMSSFCLKIDPTFLEHYHHYYSMNSKEQNNSYDMQINIKCDSLKAELLIPIPDLQPNRDTKRSSLREESFIFYFTEFACLVESTTCLLSCKNLRAGLKTLLEPYTNVLTAHSSGTELITLKIEFGTSGLVNTTLEQADLNAILDGDLEDSIYISNSNTSQQVIEPFQIKRRIIGRENEDNEQIVTPGDRAHFEKFLKTVVSMSQLTFDLSIPKGEVQFQSKEQFELIYNRFGNDLVLWVPNNEHLYKKELNEETMDQPFFSCKPLMTESYDSDSSFHSFDVTMKKPHNYMMAWKINCNDLTFDINTNFGEERSSSIFGENIFFGFAISSEDNKSNSICFSSENLTYKSNGQTIISGNIFNDADCCLNLAVDILRNETGDLKTIKMAIQLCNPALYEINIDMFKDIWDFVNVTDEEVLGYVPPKVLTELHVDIVQGAVTLDQKLKRPVLVTFDNIYITSMVVEKTNQVLLRIIADDTLICFKRNKTAAETLKNYICIVQSGLIDLNLKLDNSNEDKIEFRVSNNAIDIRACPDSFSALCQLIESLVEPKNSKTIVGSEQVNTTFNDNCLDDGLLEDAMSEENEEIDSPDEISIKSDDDSPMYHSHDDSPKIDESGFFILGDDDLGAGIKMSSEPQIRILTSEPIRLLENHFGISRHKVIPEITPATIMRYLLEEMTLMLHLYDGKDFDDDESEADKIINDVKSAKNSLSNNHEPRVRFFDGSVHLWESLDLASAPNVLKINPSSSGISSSFKTSGGIRRQTDTCVQLCFNKVKSLFENFDESVPISWRFYFFVQEIEVIDRVYASRIKKMLYEYSSESMPRKRHMNMVSIKATTYRNATDKHEECDLRISVKPLRINIDQDTLMFIGEFFSTVIATLNSTETAEAQIFKQQETASLQYDVTMHNCIDDSLKSANVDHPIKPKNVKPKKIYFRSFAFIPDVPIRLDYHGKRVDFEKGALKGLFLGLAQLNQSELRLRRLYNKHGMLGLDKVIAYAVNEWTRDIKRNQLPSLLGGVGPMHSFIQLFQGVRDLFWMPIDQYRRDKRLVRGLQRGAMSFSSSTAMGVIDLANRFVYLIQSTAQFAHDLVTPPIPGHHQTSVQFSPSQPRDIREGMAAAYTVMREGLHDTVRGVATAGLAADDMSGAIGVVVRQIPSTLCRPFIHVSQATSNVLVGVRNQLTPEARKDDQDKWKNSTDR